ncbi:MAG: helicase-related protein [Bacteroidota bacterium]|nr:helicase-related protein [Bacteroidota bacterium]MDE2646130.1 helicase-related protein [Bacteroidota bacterium]
MLPNEAVTVVSIEWFGSDNVELTYKSASGNISNELLSREDENRITIATVGRPWSFDGNGADFRLVSEAQRIRLAHLFDPLLAIHTSNVDPLPHQITAVYQEMLPRQPLRFLLADDPGAGKTIMAGLLIKELMARGDLERCLIVCPGSLAEQWQDELYQRFHLNFEILTNDKLKSARTNNWFLEANLVIARLDKLSRDEELPDKLKAPDAEWDLVVCDEAHKMSATFYGREIKYTKRYRLGQLLSGLTRHFLLMTATPHNGKESDFQLFLALLDGDRFEGRFRDGVHTTDASDLMRRMVKERLVKFDGRPLFPERLANTVAYQLSDEEANLYSSVTDYVTEEFSRADELGNRQRAGTVGFALTLLQRRLASSPEAIYQSLRRRRERLESQLRELRVVRRGRRIEFGSVFADLSSGEIEDLEDIPEFEFEDIETKILDQATAAQSIRELETEINTLKALESHALTVRRSGRDTKWNELATILDEIFADPRTESRNHSSENNDAATSISSGPVRGKKLVIFTEHTDSLKYLHDRIVTRVGRPEVIKVIHGGVGRQERLAIQEAFWHDRDVQILLATDAASEGINLQRAHLMVNYDLPWNPNRLEQRFGRIHRIGQTEVCHLWNLVAEDTREGDVYRRLLEKLDQARESLGGQVFDVLGKLEFEGKPLRDLLLNAIRYGEKPEVQARLTKIIDQALDPDAFGELLEEKQLVIDAMDTSRLQQVRDEMERAEVRRLQPHYIESFFLEAFKQLGGRVQERESGRYEVKHVPSSIRSRDRESGVGNPVLRQYERIVFKKDLIFKPLGKPPAAFVTPGHPLLNAVMDLTLRRYKSLLKQGSILVDERDNGITPRVLFSIKHVIQDGNFVNESDRRTLSERVLYVEIDENNEARHLRYAPYLDYRPLSEKDPSITEILESQECSWINRDLEKRAQLYTIKNVAQDHLSGIKIARFTLIEKTKNAVKERLGKEISYWDHRADQLKLDETAGKTNARLHWSDARRRADNLHTRLKNRLEKLKRDAQISSRPPIVLGGLLVIPQGLIAKITEQSLPDRDPIDTQLVAAKAREIVMDTERKLGFEPIDREFEKLGYDIESRDPETGRLRFIEVKGRRIDADHVTVTRNEVLCSLTKPEQFILALVLFDQKEQPPRISYVQKPFRSEPDFGVTSVNYSLRTLLNHGRDPLKERTANA